MVILIQLSRPPLLHVQGGAISSKDGYTDSTVPRPPLLHVQGGAISSKDGYIDSTVPTSTLACTGWGYKQQGWLY